VVRVEAVEVSPVARPAAAGEKPAQVRKFGRLAGPLFEIALSPDGTHVYALDKGVTRYALATGEKGWTTDLPAGADTLAVSPDGRLLLAWGHDHVARVLDAATGKERRTFKGPAEHTHFVVISPDGTRAVSTHGDPDDEKAPRSVRVWDFADGKELFQLKGHAEITYGIAFSPDGKRIATASYDGTVRLWDAADGKELHTFTGHQGAVAKVAFTPDGGRLVSCGQDTTVRVWDIAGKKETARFDGHDVWASALAVTPDGTRVVSAGWGEGNGGDGLRVWDLATGKQIHHFPEVRGILYTITITPDSTHAVTGGEDGFIRVWRLPPAEGKR
jgi:WD40 repeat protein